MNVRIAARTICALIIAGLAMASSAALAQAWPSKPIRIVVAFPPGGVGDLMARLIATPLSEALGQPVLVDNRSGGGGNVGSGAAAKLPADGYNLLVTATSVESINPLIFPSMGFDPEKDLAKVAMLGGVKLFLIARPDFPARDVREFVAHAKSRPGKLSYASASPGSMTHLAAELFKQQAGFFATHIPYRGAAPALQDLLAGQVDYLLDPGIAFQHVRSGKLKMLAVASMTRSSVFPDVPTLDEVGFKGVTGDTLFAMYAPQGTPPEITRRLNREVNLILQSPAVKARLADVGGETLPMTAIQFSQVVDAEKARFGPLIKSRAITVE
jgi:tripartite-type tricarboxylate transporter receptor subunit TctC